MSFSKCEQTSRRCFKERGMIEKFNFWHKKKTEKRKKKVGLESLQPISICACVRARDDVGEEADCQSSGCWISENTEWGFGSKSRDICWLKLFNPRLLYLAIRFYKEIQLFKQFPLFPSIPKGFFLMWLLTVRSFISTLYAHIGKMLWLSDIFELDFNSWRENKMSEKLLECLPSLLLAIF